MKGWDAKAVDRANSPASVRSAGTSTLAPTKDTKAPVAKPQSQETTEDVTPPPAKSEAHYIGPYQLAVANGTHYPGRARIVIVGPASDTLTAALVAALTQFTS